MLCNFFLSYTIHNVFWIYVLYDKIKIIFNKKIWITIKSICRSVCLTFVFISKVFFVLLPPLNPNLPTSHIFFMFLRPIASRLLGVIIPVFFFNCIIYFRYIAPDSETPVPIPTSIKKDIVEEVIIEYYQHLLEDFSFYNLCPYVRLFV